VYDRNADVYSLPIRREKSKITTEFTTEMTDKNKIPQPERSSGNEVECNGLLADCDLKPCPFCEPSEVQQCGNEPVLSHLGGFIDEDGRKFTNGLAVICPHCLAQGPKMGEKDAAAEAWNERSISS
jgi:hypothetical protein